MKVSTEFLSDIIHLLTDKEVEVLRRLQGLYIDHAETSPMYDMDDWNRFSKHVGFLGWEAFFCPDSQHYRGVLNRLHPDDVVFDVGAGDLRLSYLMANRCKEVIAVEVNPEIVGLGLRALNIDIPPNLIVITANGLRMGVPPHVTLVVCLMRHFQHPIPPQWRLGRGLIHNIGGRLQYGLRGGCTILPTCPERPSTDILGRVRNRKPLSGQSGEDLEPRRRIR